MSKLTYKDLLTSEHKNIEHLVNIFDLPIYDIKSTLESLKREVFIIEQATGNQLDIIGKYVGISRKIEPPLEDDVFMWDDDILCWDVAEWKGDSSSEGYSDELYNYLTDNTMRFLIKFKLLNNYWIGTKQDYYEKWLAAFPDKAYFIGIIDYMDMSGRLVIFTKQQDRILRDILDKRIIDFKPVGVRFDTDVFTLPAFAWDVEYNGYYGGWDEGNWLDTAYSSIIIAEDPIS